MRGTLTPSLIKNLDAISVEYLRSQGVSEEPTTWVPPLPLLDGLSLPGVPAEMIKPKKIHDLLAMGLTIPAVARRLEVSVWKVRYQIEHHPMPATMAASRQPKKIKGRIELKAGERIWSQT
jgi:hypothetical protein